MNTERLKEFIDFLRESETSLAIQEKWNELADSLSNLAREPHNESFQNRFSTTYANLEKVTQRFEGSLAPAQEAFLSEIDGLKFFSHTTLKEIEEIIARNPLTPVKVRDHVNNLKDKRSEFLKTLSSVSEGLDSLGVKAEPIETGEAQLGISIPRDLFNDEFGGFISELKTLNLIIKIFAEATPDADPEITVRQISSTDPFLFFGLDTRIIVAIGGTVTWLLATWKQSLDIRKHYQDLKEKGISEKALEPLKEEIQKKIDDAIKERTTQILGTDKTKQSGRDHEIVESLQWAMKSLLARIERGLVVEVRVLPPPTQEEAESEDAEAKERHEQFSEAARISGQLKFPRPEGLETLTSLPPPQPTEDT